MDNEIKTEGIDNPEGDAITGYKSVDDFTKDGFKILIESTKNANGLPSEKAWNFHSTNPRFSSLMSEQGNKVLGLINTIMRKYGKNDNIKLRNLDEKIDLIIDTNDSILENVANHIDEINGIRKVNNEPIEIQTVTAQLPIINGSWNKINKAKFTVNPSLTNKDNSDKLDTTSINLLTAKNITRPQKFFKDKIDNSNKYPWEPRIKEKPNSIKPLALYLEETPFGESFCHPYEVELEKFAPTEDQLKLEIPKQPKPLEETPYHEISTPEQLNELVNELQNYKEIAVDLEHHSYRSFMGITCLMQISTIDADYIIDTLALRDKLYILNEVFTKPTIVKVFHGADNDIQWLQRDLSLYVVNMFDTHQAVKLLGYSRLSLSFLLSKFCNFKPNKQFQLADWRIRPLPDQLKYYARDDTHYLLYLYHCLKKELLEKSNNQDNMLRSVINLSTEVCKKVYFKPILTEYSHLNVYRKCNRLFDNRQMYALKHLHAWRDKIAREEDESLGYVLPNHMLLQIAETIPREIQGILACCNPIPPLIRSNLLELHKIILKARDQPLQKAIMNEENRSSGSTQQLVKINVNNPLFCPHDLTAMNEFRDDLPTLLSGSFTNTLIEDVKLNLDCVTSKIKAFNISSDKINAITNKTKLNFLGPYERYKLVKPYIQAEEEKNKKKKVEEKAVPEEEDKVAKLHNFETLTVKEEEVEISTQDEIEKLQSHIREEMQMRQNGIKSLVEMGGNKKRKRQQSDEADCSNSNKVARFEDNLQTTAPKQTRNRKRKAKHTSKGTEYGSEMHHYTGKQPKVDFRRRTRQWTRDNTRPFDYSAVDYKQFQGGAEGINTNKKNANSNFKPKQKRNNRTNKSQNRSATFTNNSKAKQ